MKLECIRTNISFILSKIGFHIGCHPQFYIAIPFLFALILASGLLNLSAVKDVEYIYFPTVARSRVEEKIMETLFPTNMSEYDFGRISKYHSVGVIIAVSKNKTFLLDEYSLEDLVKVDEIIQNVSFFSNNQFVHYKDLCSKTIYKTCVENFAISLKGKSNDIKKGIYSIRYPIDMNHQKPIISAMHLGGVVLNKDFVQDFQAAKLFYFLDDSTGQKKELASQWEKQFLETVSNINLKNIKIFVMSRQSLDNEIGKFAEKALPLLFILFPLMLIFAAVSCLSSDGITSKIWLGIAGTVSPFFATVAAFGLLLYCKMEYIDLNIIVLFLVQGIGIDDAFILIAAWRKTDENYSVPQRMSKAYEKAAVSITITSITNFVAFCMTLIIPYRCIRIFSVYAALAIVFDYIFQICFFGGFMALDGYREKYNIHSILCWPVKPNNKRKTSTHLEKQRKRKENLIIKFFSEILGEILRKTITKISVIIIYIFLLSGAIYYIRFIREGEHFIKLFPFNSFLTKFYKADNKYFTTYPHQIQIVINETLDYSDINVQNDIENILNSFESAPFIANSSLTESWLREYITFSKSPIAKFSLSGYNLSNLEDFLNGFRNIFLKINNTKRFKNDVLFSNEGNNISATRFLVTSHNVRSFFDEKFLLQNLRRIADNSKYSVTVYNFIFNIYDLYINCLVLCIQTIGITVILVLLIFLLIYPNLFFIFTIALTIISIQVSLIGYMVLWNISVNIYSMMIIIICTGFCVDYTAHISYAYISSKSKLPNEKIKECLRYSGYPVIQGCVSTVLSVSVMYFGPTAAFVTFFKIIFLMVLFSVFHSIILLPVILSIFDSISLHCQKQKEEEYIRNV